MERRQAVDLGRQTWVPEYLDGQYLDGYPLVIKHSYGK